MIKEMVAVFDFFFSEEREILQAGMGIFNTI